MKETPYHVHISAREKYRVPALGEVWQYRDLIWLFTKKVFTVSYAQTILGPVWLVLTPLISSLVYTAVFGQIAALSTEGTPKLLFYLFGSTFWAFFSACLTKNAEAFTANANLFGKVYFPRLTVPLSHVLTALLRLGIQLVLLLIFLFVFAAMGLVTPHWWAWLLLPAFLLHLAAIGMGVGIIISSLTTKYRDLTALITFAVQLWMYATPVVYPLSQLQPGLLRTLSLLNPLTMPMELLRYAFLGVGTFDPGSYALSLVFALAVLIGGTLLFTRVERTFMDTV